MSPTIRKIAVLLLLLVGVQFWLLIGRGQYGSAPSPLVFAMTVGVASLPWVYRLTAAGLERARNPTPRTRVVVTAVIFLAAAGYFVATARFQERDLAPKLHDEHMHLLQTQMLARGRLWMPAHPQATSFESFHVFVTPRYAAIYFPGTALLYLPAVWLHLPYWLMPALVAGGAVALFYRVLAELIDGLAGLLGALLMVSLTELRFLSVVMMSQTAMLLLGLAIVLAWLRWERTPSRTWAIVVGALGGWAAITRPVDALCWSAIVGVAMLWTMRRWRVKDALVTIGLIALAALPFLLLQIALNVGVTGRVFQTPYRQYCDLFTPQMSYGFHEFDPSIRPKTDLLQRQMYYDSFTMRAAREHRPELLWHNWTHERFPRIAQLALPTQLLLIFFPCGLMAIRGQRWVLAGILPLFVALYAPFAYLLSYYVILVAPAVIFIVLLGFTAIADAFPNLRQWLWTCQAALIILFSLRALPEFNRLVRDDVLIMPTMTLDHRLPSLVRQPALVMYRFDPVDSTDGEPVYNVDAPWPDDAPIIRAHYLSPEQNDRLIAYYGQRQPGRHVYLIDRGQAWGESYRPQYLGTAGELSQSHKR